MLRGNREHPRPGGGWSEIGTFQQPNKRIHGGIRDARWDREASCGRMTAEVRVNGESRLCGFVQTSLARAAVHGGGLRTICEGHRATQQETTMTTPVDRSESAAKHDSPNRHHNVGEACPRLMSRAQGRLHRTRR